jgi:hypothetical protein
MSPSNTGGVKELNLRGGVEKGQNPTMMNNLNQPKGYSRNT